MGRAEDDLRAVGLRVTRPRLAVLAELSAHPHADVDTDGDSVSHPVTNADRHTHALADSDANGDAHCHPAIGARAGCGRPDDNRSQSAQCAVHQRRSCRHLADQYAGSGDWNRCPGEWV